MTEWKDVTICNKIDKSENWRSVEDFATPGNGELIVYQDAGNAPRLKVGDGNKKLKDIPFINNVDIGKGEGAIQQITHEEVFTIDSDYVDSKVQDKTSSKEIKTGAFGDYSTELGGKSQAKGKRSVAEGTSTIALGDYSHSEGNKTFAEGRASHAEGLQTEARGDDSHSEGYFSISTGSHAHAEGYNTHAKGHASHAEGNGTIASGEGQHVQGRWNVEDEQKPDTAGYRKYAHIVGNGTDDKNRSNAHTLDWNGNAWYAGEVRVGGNSYDKGKRLATEEYVGGKVNFAETTLREEMNDTASTLSKNMQNVSKDLNNKIDKVNNYMKADEKLNVENKQNLTDAVNFLGSNFVHMDSYDSILNSLLKNGSTYGYYLYPETRLFFNTGLPLTIMKNEYFEISNVLSGYSHVLEDAPRTLRMLNPYNLATCSSRELTVTYENTCAKITGLKNCVGTTNTGSIYETYIPICNYRSDTKGKLWLPATPSRSLLSGDSLFEYKLYKPARVKIRVPKTAKPYSPNTILYTTVTAKIFYYKYTHEDGDSATDTKVTYKQIDFTPENDNTYYYLDRVVPRFTAGIQKVELTWNGPLTGPAGDSVTYTTLEDVELLREEIEYEKTICSNSLHSASRYNSARTKEDVYPGEFELYLRVRAIENALTSYKEISANIGDVTIYQPQLMGFTFYEI